MGLGGRFDTPHRRTASLRRRTGATARRRRATLGELRQRARELEGLQQSTGARDVPQDKPGAFRRIIGLLSSFEFAEAGFVEELFGDGNLGTAIARAGSEFYEGLRNLPLGGFFPEAEGAKKRGFGEVFENLHVPEFGRVSNIIPGAKDFAGGLFDITGRGVAGLLTSIAADPLTYLSFGGSKAIQFSGKFGKTVQQGTELVAASVGDIIKSNRKGLALVAEEARKRLPLAERGRVRKLFGKTEDLEGKLKFEEITDPQVRQAFLDRAKEDAISGLEADLTERLTRKGLTLKDAGEAALALRTRQFSIFKQKGEVGNILRRSIGATKKSDLADIERLVDLNVTRRQVQLTRAFVDSDSMLYKAASLAAHQEAQKVVVAAAKSGDTSLLADRGIFWMGRRIPGTERAATMMSGVKPRMIEALGKFEKATGNTGAVPAALRTAQRSREMYDSLAAVIGESFVGQFKTRAFKAYNAIKALHFNGRGAMFTKQNKEFEEFIELPLLKAYGRRDIAAAGKRIVRSIDEGTTDALNRTDRGVADYIVSKNNEWALTEMRLGLLEPDKFLENYMAHYYLNTPEEIRGVIRSFGKEVKGVDRANIGRHAEERAFQTLQQAEGWSKHMNALDPNHVVLKPLDDPLEIMRRRGEHHINAVTFGDMYDSIRRELPDRFQGRLLVLARASTDPADPLTGLVDAAQSAQRKAEAVRRTMEDTTKTAAQRKAARNEISAAERTARETRSAQDAILEPRIAQALDEGDIPARLRDYIENTREEVLNPQTIEAIEEAIATNGIATNVQFIQNLPQAGKYEFFRRAFMTVTTRKQINKMMTDYDDFAEYWPKSASLVNQVAPDGSKYGFLSGPGWSNADLAAPIRDDLADAGKDMFDNKEVPAWLTMYDRLQGTWKQAVTIYFPAFPFRNAYSNVSQAFTEIGMASMNPQKYKQAIRVIATKSYGDELEYAWKATGEKYSLGQVRREAESLGVITQRMNDLELGLQSKTGSQKPFFQPFRGRVRARAADVNLKLENTARLQLYMVLRDRGMDKWAASARVQDTLFNYELLTRTEKEFFRRVFPFYTWTRKNIELQVRTLATHPGRIINQVKPVRGRDEENQSMIQWRGEALKMRLDRDGNTIRMLNGIDLPIKSLDLIWKGSLGRTMSSLVGMANPFLKTLIEVPTQQNLFTGERFTRKESGIIGRMIEPMPRSIKNWMGYRKRYQEGRGSVYSFDAERFYLLFQSFTFSRIVSTSDRQFRDYLSDDRWGAALLDVTTNLRLEKANLNDEQRRRLRERIPQLERSLERRGIGGTFEKFFEFKEPGEIE